MPDDTPHREMVPQPPQCHLEVLNHHLQFTTDEGHISAQDEESIYYGIPLNLTERRVIISRPAPDSEEPLYNDIIQPCSPTYQNVPLHGGPSSPNGHLKAQEVSGSHIYLTVM